MTDRATFLAEFLHDADSNVTWLPADASTRRYGRLQVQNRNCIIMDAPPSPATRTTEFLAIAKLLRQYGLAAPEVYKADTEQGFLLLEDFGTALFSDLLDDETTENLYGLAYGCIEALQARITTDPKIAPAYDSAVMTQNNERNQQVSLKSSLQEK